MKPDMLLFLSDQHGAGYTGYEGGLPDTPNLDRLSEEGTYFSAHYTACPMCVPARMSFLSGRLPSRVGVTSNAHTLSECTPTFLFPLVEAGYETVLIGRMHFLGKDLRHGFTKRIGEDITQSCWSIPRRDLLEERGELFPAFSSAGSLSVVGGGESPVIYYDQAIVEQALKYLSCPHEKPQFIVVGTFGPHSPYVADPVLYEKYKRRGVMPRFFNETTDVIDENPWIQAHQKEVSKEQAANACAAYCALTEQTDSYVGQVRAAFERYAKKAGHRAIFGYTSDHGDTCGERGIYGKQTFFENSVRVPLVFAGDGIPAGKHVEIPTSMMDLGPTFCQWAGTSYTGRFVDGQSFDALLTDVPHETLETWPVLSEYLDSVGGGDGGWGKQNESASKKREPLKLSYGIMVRMGHWKFIRYHHCKDVLFHLKEDPEERFNVAMRYPDIARQMGRIAEQAGEPKRIEREHLDRIRMTGWLRSYEAAAGFQDRERWKDNPPTARGQLAAR